MVQWLWCCVRHLHHHTRRAREGGCAHAARVHAFIRACVNAPRCCCAHAQVSSKALPASSAALHAIGAAGQQQQQQPSSSSGSSGSITSSSSWARGLHTSLQSSQAEGLAPKEPASPP